MQRLESAGGVTVPKKPRHDPVTRPAGYVVEGLPECIEVIEALGLPHHLACAFAYIWRSGRKPGAAPLEDIRKARWYLDRWVALQERGGR